MKRKILKYILDLFGLEEYLDGMAYEIQCNKDYISVLEKGMKEYKQIVKGLKEDIIKLKSENESRGKFCADKWISCNHILPSISIRELLVTDGEISSIASYDIYTKQFLRCYGSHTMRIPNPIAWQLIPEPPTEWGAGMIYNPPKVDKRKGMEITYIRD